MGDLRAFSGEKELVCLVGNDRICQPVASTDMTKFRNFIFRDNMVVVGNMKYGSLSFLT
jgi:hypothetical protein